MPRILRSTKRMVTKCWLEDAETQDRLPQYGVNVEGNTTECLVQTHFGRSFTINYEEIGKVVAWIHIGGQRVGRTASTNDGNSRQRIIGQPISVDKIAPFSFRGAIIEGTFQLCLLTRKEREEDDSELASIEQNNVVTITFQWIPDNAPLYWDRPIPEAPNGKPQSIGKRGKSAGLADALRHFPPFVGLEGQS